MTLQDRINQLFAENPDKTNADLARFADVTRATVSNWRLGKVNTIEGDNAIAVAKFFGVNQVWVQNGKGEKYPSKIKPYCNAAWLGNFYFWDESMPLSEDEVALPFFREVQLGAGNGVSEVQENYGVKMRFSKKTLKQYNVIPEKAACVTVLGNSMEPVIPDGTSIGIDTGNTQIKDGDLYAIDHDGHLRVKIAYKMPGGGLRLRSFNQSEWPDENYSFEDAKKIKIIGRVFWWAVLR